MSADGQRRPEGVSDGKVVSQVSGWRRSLAALGLSAVTALGACNPKAPNATDKSMASMGSEGRHGTKRTVAEKSIQESALQLINFHFQNTFSEERKKELSEMPSDEMSKILMENKLLDEWIEAGDGFVDKDEAFVQTFREGEYDKTKVFERLNNIRREFERAKKFKDEEGVEKALSQKRAVISAGDIRVHRSKKREARGA